jgi:class 3 adenylate cyclase
MVDPETRYARGPEGSHIAYQTLGNGPLDLVFLPQISCIDVMWEDSVFAQFLHRVSRLGRLICLDWRGNGVSDPIPLGAIPTIDAWSDDVLAVLDAVDSSSAVVLGDGTAGSSMAMFLAAANPERVQRLVVLNGAARWLFADDYPAGIPPELAAQYVDAVEAMWGTGMYGTQGWAPSRAGDPTFRRWHARFERLTCSPATARALTSWSFDLDVRLILPSIRVPTLVLQVRDSPTFLPKEFGVYLSEHIPDARVVVVPGRDFGVYGDASDEVAAHIEEFVTGSKPVVEADRVLATVLFTDIVSSTERASGLGDRRWADLLDRHDAIVDAELRRHRGRKVHATGDGVLATFDGPARAIRCAMAIRDGVHHLGLQIRSGIHTGECELRGEDIGGIAVHTAARVSAMAGPEEVLVSRTVVDLVAGSGLEFSDRGDHELKGVPGTWKLFSVKG